MSVASFSVVCSAVVAVAALGLTFLTALWSRRDVRAVALLDHRLTICSEFTDAVSAYGSHRLTFLAAVRRSMSESATPEQADAAETETLRHHEVHFAMHRSLRRLRLVMPVDAYDAASALVDCETAILSDAMNSDPSAERMKAMQDGMAEARAKHQAFDEVAARTLQSTRTRST